MAIFLDTGSIEDVERFMRMGIIRGVTTNPTILLKSGVTGGKEAIARRSVEIAKLIAPYPLSVSKSRRTNRSPCSSRPASSPGGRRMLW